jgi:hypothetical protein
MFDFKSLIKYVLEGLAVAVAAYVIPRRKADPKEIALIALTAAAIFAVLDLFAPQVGAGARQGAGFGIGLQQVGFGGGENANVETYDDYDSEGFEDASGSKPALCKKLGNGCVYNPDSGASADHRAQYVCHMDGDQCKPVKACHKTAQNTCDWTDAARGLPATSGRSCEMGDVTATMKVCKMAPRKTNEQDKEGFDDGVAGFEGFNKSL